MNVKQVIVMRTDTHPAMRKGKMIAQGAHASLMFLTKRLTDPVEKTLWAKLLRCLGLKKDKVLFSEEAKIWMEGSFAKVCLQVNSEEELVQIYEEAVAAGLECHMVVDSGRTEFKGPTRTCLAIGPNRVEAIDEITGPYGKHQLKLL